MNSGSVGFAGHAAIVSTSTKQTVESFARKFSPVSRDGVVIISNDWAGRTKVVRLGVYGSSLTKRTAAAT